MFSKYAKFIILPYLEYVFYSFVRKTWLQKVLDECCLFVQNVLFSCFILDSIILNFLLNWILILLIKMSFIIIWVLWWEWNKINRQSTPSTLALSTLRTRWTISTNRWSRSTPRNLIATTLWIYSTSSS